MKTLPWFIYPEKFAQMFNCKATRFYRVITLEFKSKKLMNAAHKKITKMEPYPASKDTNPTGVYWNKQDDKIKWIECFDYTNHMLIAFM